MVSYFLFINVNLISRGIKSSGFDKSIVKAKLFRIVNSLIENGCQAIVLGCTELPLAIDDKEHMGIPIINPSWIMARFMIDEADPTKLVV